MPVLCLWEGEKERKLIGFIHAIKPFDPLHFFMCFDEWRIERKSFDPLHRLIFLGEKEKLPLFFPHEKASSYFENNLCIISTCVSCSPNMIVQPYWFNNIYSKSMPNPLGHFQSVPHNFTRKPYIIFRKLHPVFAWRPPSLPQDFICSIGHQSYQGPGLILSWNGVIQESSLWDWKL